jgi:DNA-binding transcriptional ArsR family regulator
MTIPDHIRHFVLTSIPSVAYLEAAMLMRHTAHGEYTISELASQLYVPDGVAVQLLEALRAAGVVDRSDDGKRFRYAPRHEVLRRTLDELAACYASDLVGITTLIHEAA